MKIKNNIIIRLLSLLFLSICIGLLLLVGVYSISTDRIYNNAKASESLFISGENKIDNWVGYLRHGRIDNSTDSLMINIAVCRKYRSAFVNALLNPYSYCKEEVFEEGSTSDIRLFLYEDNIGGYSDYPRYWHGYLLYLVPGLLFFNIGDLKFLMMVVELLLAMVLLFEVGKINPIYMFCYAIGLLFVNPITTMINFQNADVIIIAMIFSIAIVKFKDYFLKENNYIVVFALIGICTSYFDFLTYPLVSWGFPMTTLLIIDDSNLKDRILKIVYCSLSWSFGYFGMWLGKWLLTTVFTTQDVISDAMFELTYRSGNIDNNGKEFSYFDVLLTNYESFNSPAYAALFALSAVVIVAYLIYSKKRIKLSKDILFKAIPYFIICVGPFAWYFVVKNHSITHSNLEFRNYSITLLNILIAFVNLHC